MAKNAYQLAQGLAAALREEYGEPNEIIVWSAAEHGRFSGRGETAPAICWEGGPYEWAVALTGWDGERISDEQDVQTGAKVRAAWKALRDAGFYGECTTSFILALYPTGGA